MKKTIALVLLLICVVAFSGCSSGAPDNSIVVFNWVDYVDPEVLKEFTAETGIAVKYVTFDINENMYTKLARGGGSYDVIFPSDYMITRLVDEDLVHPLDKSKLPNAAHLFDWLQDAAYDPGNAHSIPYMWGTVGILYNTEVTGGPIDSWGAMWDTTYMRNVLMIDSFRDTMGVTLKYLGYDINTRNIDELHAVRDKLIEQRESGVLLAYGVDQIKDQLISGEAALGLVWSGDALSSIAQNDKLAYAVPKEGSNVWVDGMCIPKSAKNVEGAYALIDFLLRPDIAARNSAYIGYSTPNAAAMDLLGPDYADDPTFNPSQEVIDRCQFFLDLGDFVSTYERIWQEATTN